MVVVLCMCVGFGFGFVFSFVVFPPPSHIVCSEIEINSNYV